MNLKIGDVVEHTISGKRKVIVGIEDSRYFCLEQNDLTPNGQARKNSRISIHSGNNFYIVGNIPNARPINTKNLFFKKKVITEKKPSPAKEYVLIFIILSMATIIILATATSLIFNIRKGVENLLVNKARVIKEQIKNEVRSEAIKAIKR